MRFNQRLQRIAGALVLALAAVPASAATMSYTAATSVLDTDPGTISVAKGGTDRYIATNALGAADGEFYSLGLGGAATFGFGRSFSGTSEIRITEVTFGSLAHVAAYGETIDVFAVNGGIESFVGSLTGFDAYSGVLLSFTGTFDALRLVDVTQGGTRLLSFDGFDIDSIEVGSIAPVPLPAAAGGLLAGLALLAAVRRRV